MIDYILSQAEVFSTTNITTNIITIVLLGTVIAGCLRAFNKQSIRINDVHRDILEVRMEHTTYEDRVKERIEEVKASITHVETTAKSYNKALDSKIDLLTSRFEKVAEDINEIKIAIAKISK